MKPASICVTATDKVPKVPQILKQDVLRSADSSSRFVEKFLVVKAISSNFETVGHFSAPIGEARAHGDIAKTQLVARLRYRETYLNFRVRGEHLAASKGLYRGRSEPCFA